MNTDELWSEYNVPAKRQSGNAVVRAMVLDLKNGAISPAACFRDLDDYYGSFKNTGVDPQACFSEACRVFGSDVGCVLVVTDKGGQTVLTQADDPGEEMRGAEMAAALAVLAEKLRGALERRTHPASREYPIFVMPDHHYVEGDGPRVARYGQYITSFWIGLRAQPEVLKLGDIR